MTHNLRVVCVHTLVCTNAHAQSRKTRDSYARILIFFLLWSETSAALTMPITTTTRTHCVHRVLDVLPRLLGKSFFLAKKQPIPVKISRKNGDWSAQIVKARDATYLHLGKGPCSSLKVRGAHQATLGTWACVRACVRVCVYVRA